MPSFLAVFLLAFARLAGVAIALPSIAGRSITQLRFRLAAASLLALWVTPIGRLPEELMGADAIQLVTRCGSELLVGLVLGVGVYILFVGVQVVSQVLSNASGLSLGSFMAGDPASAPLTRFLDQLSLAMFLVIGGHRMVMEVILTTMREVPLGGGHFHQELIESLASLLTLSFALGLRASFPVLVSLLTATIAVGALSRFLPRFQMFVSAAGINGVVLVGSLFLFMGTVGWTLQDQIPVYLERLVACLETAT